MIRFFFLFYYYYHYLFRFLFYHFSFRKLGDPFPLGGVLGLGLEIPYIYMREMTDEKRRRNRGEKRNVEKKIEMRTAVTAQNPGCPLTTRQPAENLYVSYRETHT